MSALQQVFNRKMLDIYGLSYPTKIAVALSGGVDSIALASVASKWARTMGVDIHAYIIDHQLRPESGYEAEEVRKYASGKFGIKTSLTYRLDNPEEVRIDGRVEEWARDKRRDAFSHLCSHNNVKSLLMAHHFDDQRELFLMRLIKGSHWRGLAGMRYKAPLSSIIKPKHRPVDICRPFLDLPKKTLIEHCRLENLRWWDDSTNDDASYTKRNLIRQYFDVTPESNLPSYVQPENFRQTLHTFSAQNETVMSVASQLYSQLKLAKKLKVSLKSSVAFLNVEDHALRLTPAAILTELIYRLAVQVSPASYKSLGAGRHKLSVVCQKIKSGEDFTVNCLQVEFKCSNNIIEIKREKPRRSQLSEFSVFRADLVPSDFKSLDNRWWIIWDKCADSGNKRRYFEARFVKNPKWILKLLDPEKAKTADPQLLELMKLHPILLWSDPKRHLIKSEHIIGYPSLGLVRGLDIKCIPKKCIF